MLAPVGVMVNTLPSQIVPLFTEITGNGITDTVTTTVLLAEQPSALAPVIEYDVSEVGDTMFVPPE